MQFREVLVILLLILLNGFFALSEMALVAAKRSRLQAAAEQGRTGRQVGHRADGGSDQAAVGDPDRHHPDRDFYRSVRRPNLRRRRWPARLPGTGVPLRYADDVAFLIVVVVIGFVTLIIGELVPEARRPATRRNAGAAGRSGNAPVRPDRRTGGLVAARCQSTPF